MIYASMFGAATAVGAFISIPIPPVPITLQTLFTYLAGALLGGRLGALSQFVYVLLGVMGLPVFALGKAGPGVLFGPTGGYIIGFMAAAYVIGTMIETKKTPGVIWILLSMITGTIVVYGFGVLQLSWVAKFSIQKAIAAGALPFLIGDTIKIIAATVITLALRDKINPNVA